MAFLTEDDRLILFNLPKHLKYSHGKGNPLQDEEVRRLKDAGCTTILNLCFWRATDSLGWEHMDWHVEQCHRFGMKCLLSAYLEPPTTFPKEWYARQGNNRNWDILSMWNMDARAEIRNYYEELLERYGGPMVNIINQQWSTGETPYPNSPFFDDRAARASWIEAQQAGVSRLDWLHDGVVEYFTWVDGLLRPQHNEVWNAFQWLISTQSPNNGAAAQEKLLKHQYELWPHAQRVLLQYTFFSHPPEYMEMIKRWRDTYDLWVITEAQHCPGLHWTTPATMKMGYDGQVFGPLHYWGGLPDAVAGNARLTEKEYAVVKESTDTWKGATPREVVPDFLDDDERLIVVDNWDHPVDPNDYVKLAAGGAKTLLFIGHGSWHFIKPKTRFAWKGLDTRVEKALDAGLKVLLMTYQRPPPGHPLALEFPVPDPYGQPHTSFMDILDPAAMDAEREFLGKVFEHYDDPRIQCIPGLPYSGEFFANEELATEWGMAHIQPVVLERLQFFADNGQGLWTFFHPAHKNVGNEYVPYNDIASRFAKEHYLNRVLWTFFTCDGTQAQLGPDAYRYWVGADYAKRVVNAASRAKHWGVHGLLMSPRPDEGPVTAEIVSEMAKAIRILNE